MGTVLSVIGTIFMVLLIVVLVLFCLICLVLFCPLCYKAEAVFFEKLTAGGRICWLFGMVWIRFSYSEGALEGTLRVFGVDVRRVSAWLKRRKREKAAKKAQKQAAKLRKTAEKGNTKKEQAVQNENRAAQKAVEQKQALKGAAEEDTVFGETETERKEQAVLKKRNHFQKLYRKIKVLPKKCMALWKRLCSVKEGIKSFFKRTDAVRKLWKSENTRKLVCIIKDNVIHLWRKLKPKVLRGNIVFGTGDPCSTGELLGAVAVFYAAYGKNIQVTPDFETAKIEGELFVKGRFSLITIVVIVIKIFLSGEWNRFRREAKELKEAF